MLLIKQTKPIDDDDDGEIPKGWHLSATSDDRTLCGNDYYSGYITKQDGRVTCKRCKEIIKYCRNKEIKLG